jgi:chromosomal replication initiation ATPase DnaA
VTAPAQLPLQLGYREALGREAFLIAPSNKVAVAWIDRWPDWPAQALAIHGPSGSGKTHLCQVWRQASGAVEVTADMLRSDEPPAYLGPSTACVVENVAASVAQEPEVARRLLHLYNMMLERGGFLLLSDRSAPARWHCPLADLRSRLAAMQAVALGEPDDELMERVLKKLFADRQLALGADVLRYLVARMERSFAAARRVVATMDRTALEERREISVPLARDVLRQLESGPMKDDET